MSTKTEAQLALEVLQEMGVVDASETTPDSALSTRVINAYENKYAELAAPGLELTYWPMTTIPQAIFTILRDLIINEVSGTFGQPIPAAQKLQQEEIILMKLRRHVSLEKSDEPIVGEYF